MTDSRLPSSLWSRLTPVCLAGAVLQGNGFVTNRDIIKEFGIHDANPFFTTLLSKPYLDQVVISPHLYGPSVSNRKDFYKVTLTGETIKGVNPGQQGAIRHEKTQPTMARREELLRQLFACQECNCLFASYRQCCACLTEYAVYAVSAALSTGSRARSGWSPLTMLLAT
jgi:hypothetical protein